LAGRNPYAVLAVLTLSTMITMYVEAMVIPSLPHIESALSATDEEAAWIVSAFLVVGAAVAPLFGKLGDVHGKKRLFLAALALYSVAILAAGFSLDVYFLISMRALQGFGFSLFPLSMAMVTDVFPRERVATAQGIISAMMAIGMTICMIAGAYIEEYLGWRAMFHVGFTISITMVIVSYLVLDEYPPAFKERVDYWSTVLLASGTALILIYLTEAPYSGWTSARQLLLISSGAALFIGFLAYAGRAANPLIGMDLLRRRNVMVANLTGLLSGVVMFTLYLGVIYYAEELPPYGLCLSVLSAALSLLPATLAMIVIAPLVGSATTNLGPRPVLAFGSLVSALGFWLFIFDRAGLLELVVDSFVTGVGVVSLMIPIVNMVAVSMPRESVTVGLGFNTTMRYLGASLGPVLAATIMTTHKYWVLYSPLPTAGLMFTEAGPVAFNYIFTVGVVFSLATLVVSLLTANYRPGDRVAL
jgi:MFS family permease